jgi:hypothetical protein
MRALVKADLVPRNAPDRRGAQESTVLQINPVVIDREGERAAKPLMTSRGIADAGIKNRLELDILDLLYPKSSDTIERTKTAKADCQAGAHEG